MTCECYIEHSRIEGESDIVQCPLCKAAPKLLAALQDIAKMPCLSDLLGEHSPDGCGCFSCVAKAAIEAAKGVK